MARELAEGERIMGAQLPGSFEYPNRLVAVPEVLCLNACRTIERGRFEPGIGSQSRFGLQRPDEVSPSMLAVVEPLQRLHCDASRRVELERGLVQFRGLLRLLLPTLEQLRPANDERSAMRVVCTRCVGELRQVSVHLRPSLLRKRSLLGSTENGRVRAIECACGLVRLRRRVPIAEDVLEQAPLQQEEGGLVARLACDPRLGIEQLERLGEHARAETRRRRAGSNCRHVVRRALQRRLVVLRARVACP